MSLPVTGTLMIVLGSMFNPREYPHFKVHWSATLIPICHVRQYMYRFQGLGQRHLWRLSLPTTRTGVPTVTSLHFTVLYRCAFYKLNPRLPTSRNIRSHFIVMLKSNIHYLWDVPVWFWQRYRKGGMGICYMRIESCKALASITVHSCKTKMERERGDSKMLVICKREGSEERGWNNSFYKKFCTSLGTRSLALAKLRKSERQPSLFGLWQSPRTSVRLFQATSKTADFDQVILIRGERCLQLYAQYFVSIRGAFLRGSQRQSRSLFWGIVSPLIKWWERQLKFGLRKLIPVEKLLTETFKTYTISNTP